MKLEVGKKYRDSNGKVIKIIKKFDDDTPYPFLGDDETSYTNEGKWFDNGSENKYNLIEEVIDHKTHVEAYIEAVDKLNYHTTRVWEVEHIKEHEKILKASERQVRDYNVGDSNYSKFKIQPWDIWLEYKLDPWDADIIKRVLRTKESQSREMDYEKIIHICREKIRQLEN